MTPTDVMDVVRQLLWMALLVAGPLLFVGMLVGLLMGVLQAATQVQDATLSFVPKLVVLAAILLFGGHWAMGQLVTFTDDMFMEVARIAPHGRG